MKKKFNKRSRKMRKKQVIITKDIKEIIGGLTGIIESKNGDFVLTIPYKGNQLWKEIFGEELKKNNLFPLLTICV